MVVLMSRLLTRVVTVGALGVLTLAGHVVAQERQVVQMVAERFTFTPSRIEVRVGTTVEIHIRSEDTDHGFHIMGGGGEAMSSSRSGGRGRRSWSSRRMSRASIASSARSSAVPVTFS